MPNTRVVTPPPQVLTGAETSPGLPGLLTPMSFATDVLGFGVASAGRGCGAAAAGVASGAEA